MRATDASGPEVSERGAATARLVSVAICRDAAGRVLVVKPTYRDGWLLPGGAVDPGESPRVGCIRELAEETGLLRQCTRLLAVDFLAGKDGPDPKPDLVQHVFDGGVVPPEEIAAMAVQEGELDKVAFVDIAEAENRLRPNQLRLLRAGLDALRTGGAVGLERGARLDGPTVWQPRAERANQRVIFIGGNGHSGSTLLGLLLGSHPDAMYGGEIRKSRVDVPARKRQCRRCGDGCAIWGPINDDRGGDVYEALSQATGRPIVVDSTKLVRWIRAEGRRAALGGVDVTLIHLERDGRAVVNSRLRKSPEADPAKLIRDWVDRNRETEALRAEWEGPSAHVRYEDLACRPEPTMRRLCHDIGLAFDPAMMAYEEREHHSISGNAGTHAATLDAFHRRAPRQIRLDERWRSELPVAVAQMFDEMTAARSGQDAP
jgi:8-oxo-dGTP pyrophosphatase MutT (NUDIX family)